MDSPVPADKLAAVKEAIFANRKIEAIKIHRQCTGSGLREAKDAVEKLEAELRTASPEKFMAERPRSGCLGVIVVCVAITGFILWSIAR